MMIKGALFCISMLVLGTSWTVAAAVTNDEYLEADIFRVEFQELSRKLWDKYGHDNNEINKNAEIGLIEEFESFGRRLHEAFPYDITHGVSSVDNWQWANAYGELRSIYSLYLSFERFQKQQTTSGRVPSPRRAWIDLVESVLSNHNLSIVVTCERLNMYIVEDRLYRKILTSMDGVNFCSQADSPRTVLLHLYNNIAITQLKGYMMIQYSYLILKLLNNENTRAKAMQAENEYKTNALRNQAAMLDAAKLSSNEYWRCDPNKYIKDENYIEITELLQGYVQNEVDLNPDGNCWENCAAYKYTKSHSCYKNLYCKQQRRCNGEIINCRFIDSDMWICPAMRSTHRRYEYIEYENGNVFGRKQACRAGTTKVDSWWRYLFWHCSYCLCYCDEQSINSDRFVNLRESVSRADEQMVLTGLKFTKKNRVVHLQIQEGRLQANGKVDNGSVAWIPVDNYSITDKNVFTGEDYHTLTWTKRAMDLDDLKAPENHVITGVKYKLIGSHLNFEIRVTPFDYRTGKMQAHLSHWMSNDNTELTPMHSRKKLDLQNRDIPIRALRRSIPDSRNNMYIEFEATDLERDAAQTTVPFFDAQPVKSLDPVPLIGVGLYHKGQEHFGGFIAPKIIALDPIQYIENARNDLKLELDRE